MSALPEQTPDRDDLERSLAEALDEGLALPRGDDGRPYVDDDEQADWALRRLGEHQTRADEVKALGQRQIDQVQAWMARQLERIDTDMRFFEGLLLDWHRRVLDEDPREWEKKKRKTIELPHGTLSARAARASLVVDDDEALTAWLTEHRSDLLEHVPEEWKYHRGKLKSALTEAPDGRLVDAAECGVCGGTGLYDEDEGEGCGTCDGTGRIGSGEVVPGCHIETGDPSYDADPEVG